MKTEDLYQNKTECCGCELCAQSCPKQIITMCPDEEGFLYPFIKDDGLCINCKKCISVCPVKSPGREPVEIKKSFSYSLPETGDLKKSASGGLATAIGRSFIRKGGVVYGVTYVSNFSEVRYERATNEEQLEKFRGSKYVQAIKGDIYKQVRKDLKDGRNVLFIGLPCEISAIYHAVTNTENLYTISLICHGPTSQKVHRDYCESIKKSTQSPITSFSVRYKLNGWKPYYIHAEYTDGTSYNEQWSSSDYGMAFLYMKRPSCRTCSYKAKNDIYGLQSDMTIGDFHGVSKKSRQYNMWGVSQACIQTEKGGYLASLISEGGHLEEIPFSVIEVTNRGLFMAIPQRGNKQRFLKDYLNHSLHYACHSPMVKRTNRWMVLEEKIARIIRGLKTPSKVIRKFRKILSI